MVVFPLRALGYFWIQIVVLCLHSSQESGKLGAYMERRRKKNASKDHRYMPYGRNGSGA
jgi:hypothetical protein